MKNQNKKNSLFTRYLFLYFITAFIPVLTACLSLFISYQALEDETIHSHQASVRMIQKSLDIKILELDKMLLNIGADSSLTKYSLKNKPLDAISSLKKTISQQDFVSDILIIGDGVDFIYSPFGSYSVSNIVQQSYMKDLLQKGYTYQEWQSLVQTQSATYWPINAFDDTPNYLYLFTPIYSLQESLSSHSESSHYNSRTAVLLIDRDFIRNLFQSSQTLMDENILLLDCDMNLLCMQTQDTARETIQNICEYLRTHPEASKKSYIEFDNNLVFLSHSEEPGLYYVRFLSRQVAYQTIYQIRNYTLLILVIVLLIGIGLIIFSMKNSYTPIRVLANWAQSYMPADCQDITTQNELTLFQLLLDHSIKENLSLTQTIDSSRQGLIDHLLTALICGNFTTQEAFFNACSNLKITLNRKYFCVCSILFEDNYSEMPNANFENIMKCIYDSLPKNLLLQAKNLLFAHKLLLLLNSDSNDIVFLENAITDSKINLLQQLGLRISVGIGSFYDSYDKVGKSYLDSVNALDYRLIYGKDCIITPDMYNVFLKENNYPNTDLELLRSALLSQNADLATSVIYRLNEYTKSKNYDLHSAKHICYDAFSILRNVPAFTNTGYSNTLSNFLNIMHLSNFETVDDFFASLLDIVHHTIGTPSKTCDSASDIGSQLVDYINTHCFSYDFQISSMAEHFSISPQYMRKLFKNHTGTGISEYVSNLKLKKAIQLLQETDMPLQDIVLEIGNTDVSGFVRSFKQKTGMTPGQYRNSCNKN